MAIEFMEAVWQISPHKAEKLLVQLACADWADGNGEFWPTYDAIAKKTRTTKPGVIRIIEQLLNEGEIVLVEKGGGRGKNNRYQFGEDYIETVSTVRQTWKRAREKKGHRELPNQPPERVIQDDSLQQERVILNQEKGNPENLHIRNNRHEPSRGGNEPSPLALVQNQPDGITDVLEEIYPGHATNFRTIRGMYDLALRLKASAADVRNFPAWLAANHPKKADSPFAFLDLFAKSLNSASTPDVPVAPRYACAKCQDRRMVVIGGKPTACECWQVQEAAA